MHNSIIFTIKNSNTHEKGAHKQTTSTRDLGQHPQSCEFAQYRHDSFIRRKEECQRQRPFAKDCTNHQQGKVTTSLRLQFLKVAYSSSKRARKVKKPCFFRLYRNKNEHLYFVTRFITNFAVSNNTFLLFHSSALRQHGQAAFYDSFFSFSTRASSTQRNLYT